MVAGAERLPVLTTISAPVDGLRTHGCPCVSVIAIMKTEKDKGTPPQPNHVTITINGVSYDVHPGNHPVAELKNRANPKIPKEDTLCIMIDGEPKPLDNKAHIDIKGGEIFASNCPSGGAS